MQQPIRRANWPAEKKTFEAPMHRDEREDIESAMYGKWWVVRIRVR